MSDNIDVNSLASLLKPLDSDMLTNAEWEAQAAVDPNNDGQLSSALREFILPEYESMDAQSRELVRASLSASLAQANFRHGTVLDRLDLAFAASERPRSLFLTLWQILYGTRYE